MTPQNDNTGAMSGSIPDYDQAHRAESILDHVLGEEGETATLRRRRVDVASEQQARPIIDVDTGRTKSRVLFVTSDESALATDSTLQREYAELAEYMDEVHVFVLIDRRGENKSVRVTDNLWTYSVHNKHWWLLPFSARSHAKDVLVFHDSVRPDFVVATDPYESGLGAYLISGVFARPLQIHVKEDFNREYFINREKANKWRRTMANFVLGRTKSARAKTTRIKEMLQAEFENIADLELIPKFYNFSGFLDATPSMDLHDKYTDFVFIILTFGHLTADSALHNVFTALHRTLNNPRIGLVIIGDGPAKELFAEKAELLGIEQSVAFERDPKDLVAYMKTADALVEADTSRESEEHVMRAAAAGLPIIAYETDLRSDLFVDGTSAFLCPADDPQCLGQKFTKFINSPALRKQFMRNGEQVARDRLIEDPDAYYRAYRDSIEVILDTYEPEEVPEAAPETPQEEQKQRVVEGGMSYPDQSAAQPVGAEK